MRALPAILLAVTLLASCSSTVDRGRMRSQLAGASPEFTSKTVEEIEKLQPQLPVPFRLAVAPPIWRQDLQWSREERAELETWGPELKAMGLVSEVVVMPSITYELGAGGKKGWFEQLRQAAARHHADAVLVIRDVDETSHWVNVLSILDLTIVGAFIAPGHSAEAASLMQALVLDNRNEYLYASAEGEASVITTQPLAYLEVEKRLSDARLAALRDLKVSLFAKAKAEMSAVAP